MDKAKVNGAIGELLCREKYRFIPIGLLGEIIRDFIEEYEKQNEVKHG